MTKLIRNKKIKRKKVNSIYSLIITLSFLLSIPLIIFNKISINQKTSLALQESVKSKIKNLLSSQTKYLAISKYGISNGHTDQADIFFNTFNTAKEISTSNIFVLGNSRTQFALTKGIFDYIHQSNSKLYHLGNGCGESIEFGLNILSKFQAKPKVLIINADYGFTDPPGGCTLKILNQPDVIYKKYLLSREKNNLIVSLLVDQVSILDYLYGNLLLDVAMPKSGYNYFDTLSDAVFKVLYPNMKWFPVEFRDIQTGKWEGIIEQVVPEQIMRSNRKIVASNSCPLLPQEITSIDNKLQTIRARYPDVRIIFLYIPNGKPEPQYCGKRLSLIKQIVQMKNVYFFETPTASSYFPFDGDHLNAASAQLYTKQLIEWIRANKILP